MKVNTQGARRAAFSDDEIILDRDPRKRTLTFSRAEWAQRCSLCDHPRKKLVKVASGGGIGCYCFCSICIRAMHKELP